MKNNTERHYSPKQGRLPVFIAESLEICDPVLAFDKIMEEIGIEQYLKPEDRRRIGRRGYSRVNMLKTILYGFMDTGYVSLRELEDRCKVNLRYMYLMDNDTPSYHCFGDFINDELKEGIEEIFKAVMVYIGAKDHVDMQHLYIDGTKLEANANKYSWVWRKGTEKSRYKLFGKVTALLSEINKEILYTGFHIETCTEYTPEQLQDLAERYAELTGLHREQFVHGRGHHMDDYVSATRWVRVKRIVTGLQNSLLGITEDGQVLCAGGNLLRGPHGDLTKRLSSLQDVVDIALTGSECEDLIIAFRDGSVKGIDGETLPVTAAVNPHAGPHQVFTSHYWYTVCLLNRNGVLKTIRHSSVINILPPSIPISSYAIGSIGFEEPFVIAVTG